MAMAGKLHQGIKMVCKKRGAFDLNYCTMRQLVQLSGISQGSARKLVRFRARQWRKAKRMDAENQARLRRRHDLMAELRQDGPFRYKVARAVNSRKKPRPVQGRSASCQNINSIPLNQGSDEREQTNTNEKQKEVVMQRKTSSKVPLNNHTPHHVRQDLSESISSFPVMKHSPDAASPHISDCQIPSGFPEESESVLHSPDPTGGLVPQDGRLFCKVCGAAEMCWVTCNQQRHFRSHVRKAECRKRRREHKAYRDKETRPSSHEHCVLL